MELYLFEAGAFLAYTFDRDGQTLPSAQKWKYVGTISSIDTRPDLIEVVDQVKIDGFSVIKVTRTIAEIGGARI